MFDKERETREMCLMISYVCQLGLSVCWLTCAAFIPRTVTILTYHERIILKIIVNYFEYPHSRSKLESGWLSNYQVL